MSERMRAALCLLGIVLLTAAWVVAGLVTTDFDPVRQSISQLQRDGTAPSVVMTVAFAPVLPRLPRTALLVAGVATLGAALAPLGEVRGGRQDAVHLAFGALQRAGFLSAVAP